MGVIAGQGTVLINLWTSSDAFIKDPASEKEKRNRLEQALVGAPRVPFQEVTLGPAVVNPGKIVCVGLNYRKHAAETGAAIPEIPVIFSKFSDAVAASGHPIHIPKDSQQLDYEAELAIVMGKEAYEVSEDEALDYVFGYCNANDISARDLQLRTSQWLLGKTCPGFAPLGPFIVTTDEVVNPNALDIRLYRNGDLVQDSNTVDMIFSCREIIAFLSRSMVLRPGDVILTGTPEGVILGMPSAERRWLKPGDQLTVEIEGLGQLTNTVVG